MKTINVNNKNFEMENFRRNMELINIQMRKNIPQYQNNSDQNAYAPPLKTQFPSFNFSELFRYMETEKYRKKYKE